MSNVASRQDEPQQQLALAAGFEVNEDDKSIRLSIDLPGVRAKDVEVSVVRGILSIRGHRIIRGMDHRIVKKVKVHRRFAVDADVMDVSRASANLFNGVLVITAPKNKIKPVTVNIPVTNDPDSDTDDELTQSTSARGKSDGPTSADTTSHVTVEPITSALEAIAPPTAHHVTPPKNPPL